MADSIYKVDNDGTYTYDVSGTTLTYTCKNGYYGNADRCEKHSSDSAYCKSSSSYKKCPAQLITCETGYTVSGNSCVSASSDSGDSTATDTPATDTVSGSCPSGLAKSADGCCCIK